VSFGRNKTHEDLLGRPIPGIVAPIEEIYDLVSALSGLSSGVIQCGSAYPLEIREGFCTRMSEISGRPVIYNQIVYNPRAPDSWRDHLGIVEGSARAGHRVYPVTDPRLVGSRYTLRNTQTFDRFPAWRDVMMGTTPEAKRAAFRDPELRARLRVEAQEGRGLDGAEPVAWDAITVSRPALPKNAALRGKTIAALAAERGVDPLDAFLDLALEEDLETLFSSDTRRGREEAVAALLQSPNVLIGLSDAGAHVEFQAGYGYGTTVLAHWVRERNILSLEEAIRKLSFMQACFFGLSDRGLLAPGFAADIVIFDPETVDQEEPEEVHDLPAGRARMGLAARGFDYTIVNGRVLIDHGQPTGELPGRVLRGTEARAAAAR
jgi:N-acyl-D-aspartate/D-glutamate deacylase